MGAMRDSGGNRCLLTVLQDLRYAGRVLRRSPGFTMVVVLILALGIGANSSLFTVVHTILLRPLPYEDPDRLAFLWTEVPKKNSHEGGSSYLNFLDWRAQSHAFADMTLYRHASLTLTGATEPRRVDAALVPDNFFAVLGVPPAIGRTFTAKDVDSRAPLAIVSNELWRHALGGSVNVIGKRLEVEGRPLEIIGVMPAHFKFPSRETQLWVTISEPWTDKPWWPQLKGWRWTKGVLDVVGRMRLGISPAEAQTEMTAIARRLEQQYPETNEGHTVRIVPLREQMTGRVRLPLLVLSGAVAFVLLIACANVASLVIARGSAREREIAIRMALGARRGTITWQFLAESVLIGVAAGALGLLLATLGVRLLTLLAPDDIPRLNEVVIRPEVLLFTLGHSLIAGALASLGPALTVSNNAPMESLKAGGVTGSFTPRGRYRRQRMLVAAEFALSFVLLAGAGVLIRSFLAIQSVDLGFESGRLLTIRVSLPAAKGAQQRVSYYDEAIQRIAEIQGVMAAGAIENFFVTGGWPEWTLTLGDGRVVTTQWDWSSVAGQYFQAIGVPLLQGRWFQHGEGRQAPSVVLVNETMARRFWPRDDVIGKRFKVGDADSRNPWLTVIGVVKDTRRHGREKPVASEFFYPHSVARSLDSMELVVRTSSDPRPLAAQLANAVRSIDRTVILESIATVEQQLGEHVSRRRFQTLLLTVFSASALALAAFGIYAVMYYSVARRSAEIGVRMALGAGQGDVLAMVLRDAVKLAGLGMVFGLAAAFGVIRVLSSMLFGVSATDPVTFAGVCFLLTCTALLASYIPARRASRVDPTVALRM